MIDDDEKLTCLVCRYLTPHGFEVEAIHDGETGLDAARRGTHELVILDLMLPGLDGLEVCRRLRTFSRIPILMLTARGEETDRIVGLEMGADDYLPKPFNARELLARIRAILRRAETHTLEAMDDRLTVGPLRVDSASRTVTLNDVEVVLTTGEFELLHALAEAAGRVLSRNQLMEKLYGSADSAYDRSIDVHISRIRKKIEEDPRQPRLLKTVRGVGYQLARVESP